MKDTENLQKKLFMKLEGRIKLDDESLPFKDKKYDYWTKTTKEGNYSKKLRKKLVVIKLNVILMETWRQKVKNFLVLEI